MYIFMTEFQVQEFGLRSPGPDRRKPEHIFFGQEVILFYMLY